GGDVPYRARLDHDAALGPGCRPHAGAPGPDPAPADGFRQGTRAAVERAADPLRARARLPAAREPGARGSGARRVRGSGQLRATEDAGVMRCPNCDAAVHEDDRYCEACGYDLVGGGVPQAAEPAPSPARWLSSGRAEQACPGCGGTSFTEEGYCE